MTAREYPLQAVVDALQVAAVAIDRALLEAQACKAALAAAIATLHTKGRE